MLHYGEVNLIYIGQGVADNGSPIELEHVIENVKISETRTFSLNYYNTSGTLQRSMRDSKNIVVPIQLTKDIVKDGIKYQLLYVQYYGVRYRVYNILNYRKSGLRMLLDIQEVR